MTVHTMKDFPERLAKILSDRHMSKTELARLLGITSSQVGHYVKGRRSPPVEQVIKIEKSLSLPPGCLIYGDLEKFNIHDKGLQINHGLRSLPVLDSKNVISWVKDDILPPNFKEVSLMGLDKMLSDKAFVMVVVGDAMRSSENQDISLNNGDRAVIYPNTNPKTGGIVIASINGSDIKIRQYQQDGNQALLKAFDPQYPVIPIDESVEILGVVKQRVTFFPDY